MLLIQTFLKLSAPRTQKLAVIGYGGRNIMEIPGGDVVKSDTDRTQTRRRMNGATARIILFKSYGG
jgi:hypothetical protein